MESDTPNGKTITIRDPVARTVYILDPATKTCNAARDGRVYRRPGHCRCAGDTSTRIWRRG